jgi:hypothetical protein
MRLGIHPQADLNAALILTREQVVNRHKSIESE